MSHISKKIYWRGRWLHFSQWENLCTAAQLGLWGQGNLWWGAAESWELRWGLIFSPGRAAFSWRGKSLQISPVSSGKHFENFFSSNKEFIEFSVPLSPRASHSQRHNIEPNHQLEQLRPLFWCKAAWKKKVPCVCSCSTCIILRNMEKLTTDFQICVFLFPIMSVMHNLHRQENVGSRLFFSFCLFSFSYRRAGTAESWDKSPTPSLVRWAQ